MHVCCSHAGILQLTNSARKSFSLKSRPPYSLVERTLSTLGNPVNVGGKPQRRGLPAASAPQFHSAGSDSSSVRCTSNMRE